MLAAGNLRQQRRCPFELAGLRQQLHEAEPAPGLGDRRRRDALHEFGRAPEVAGAPMRDDRRPRVGKLRLHAQGIQVVEQQLGVLGPLVGPTASHEFVAELGQQRAQLTLDPTPRRRVGPESLADAAQKGGAAQLLVRRHVRVTQARLDERLEARIDLDEAFEGAEPFFGPSPVPKVLAGIAQPVAFAVLPPVMAVDVVLDDPGALGTRPRQPDLGRNPEALHVAPLRLVPWARLDRLEMACARRQRGRGPIPFFQGPLERGRHARFERMVIVHPPQRVSQLGPCTIEDGGPARRDLGGLGTVGVVPQDRLPERGAQLGRRRRGLGAEDRVEVPTLASRDGGRRDGRHPVKSSAELGARCKFAMLRGMVAEPRTVASRAGHLLIIGGAEEKLRQRQILSRFTSLAGGADGRVAIISTASSLGDEATDLYRSLFRQLGIPDVRGLRPLSRADANDRQLADQLSDATGIFMTGGNQLRLSSVIGGTMLGRVLAERHRRGAVIAGTSAGASAMGSHMVAFGTSGTTPKQRMTQMSAGLGLLPGVLIDQHFEQRNRIGRLLALVAQSPALLGIGIDEDTAALVSPNGVMEVLGKGSVTILDPGGLQTDAYEVKRHRPIMVSGVILHSLPSGYRFDLRKRRLMAPLRPVSASDRELRSIEHVASQTRRLIRRIAAEGADDSAAERSRRRALRARRVEEASE